MRYLASGSSLLVAGLMAGCAADMADAEADVGSITQEVLLEETKDNCSGQLSVISTSGQRVYVSRGRWTRIDVSRRFSWYCGGTREATTCAPSTRYVWAYHSRNGRRIWWECHY